jgi:hypothetical protein
VFTSALATIAYAIGYLEFIFKIFYHNPKNTKKKMWGIYYKFLNFIPLFSLTPHFMYFDLTRFTVVPSKEILSAFVLCSGCVVLKGAEKTPQKWQSRSLEPLT